MSNQQTQSKVKWTCPWCFKVHSLLSDQYDKLPVHGNSIQFICSNCGLESFRLKKINHKLV